MYVPVEVKCPTQCHAYIGAKVWATIPEHIKNVNSVESFKTMFLKLVSKEVGPLYECEHFKIDRPT